MTEFIRRQLTLFVQKHKAQTIEKVRTRFNLRQSELINSHVTLCREDEIEDLEKVLQNLQQLTQKSITIKFGPVIRFENSKGVLLPATAENMEFQNLRQKILQGVPDNLRRQDPHITLMHPRNSKFTNKIFEAIQKANLPNQLNFKTISLIEQVNGGPWTILKTFDLTA